MTIDTAHIDKDGIVKANPYLYPVEPYWESGLLPFEDGGAINWLIWGQNGKEAPEFKPNTIVHISPIEVEVVGNCQTPSKCGLDENYNPLPNMKCNYCSILRIKN